MWKWIKNLFRRGRPNIGHRLYHYSAYENSRKAFFQGVISQCLDAFKYFEFDIVESMDGTLWVFHDATKRKTIKRMCPNAPKHLLKKSIYELYDSEIRRLYYLDDPVCKILTLKELLNLFGEHKITKPIMAEIKKLLTWDAKLELVRMVAAFKEDNPHVDIYFGSFKKKFKKNFNKNEREFWLELLEENNLRIKLW